MASWWPRHTDEEIEAVTRVLRSGCTNMWTGEEVFAFEAEYAAWVGVSDAVAVSNGTVAIEAALRALRLPPGAEVVLPCRTFVACAAAVATVGLTPVLADIGQELNITAHAVRARLTERTGAVMVVAYGGLPVGDLAEIVAECRARRISVIEDCSHAHGAAVGRLGDIATWSMCQGKLISTGGEGGMITTDNPVLAERVRAFRDHGRYQMAGRTAAETAALGRLEGKTFSWTVSELGSNLRMTEMQAAMGRVQSRGQAARWERRQAIARAYDAVTGGSVCGSRLHESALYMYLWRVKGSGPGNMVAMGNKQRVLMEVDAAKWGGCSSIAHEAACRGMIGARSCTDADAIGAEVVSLPVYHTMTDAEVAVIVEQVKRVVG